ncbi:MAG: hydrogenase nickel incorporation protein HypB [Deltaproteobacteria bacterium]|nr:hydrogenase nickel incorporation protein HypB [Deltaproteobacteria bacterium]
MEEVRLIEVKEEIMADNTAAADELRESLSRKGVFLLNLMSSPGAGKTSLVVRTIRALKDTFRIGVIEGDIDSTVDAQTVMAEGVPAVQLRTGGFCHLDAAMVGKALDAMPLDDLDLIIIENVGNLVCPAEFDTGARLNVMILSVPEGDDKPLKYPLMFTISQVLLVNKIDYLKYEEAFDIRVLRERVFNLNPTMEIFEISCKTGEGFGTWINWLAERITPPALSADDAAPSPGAAG